MCSKPKNSPTNNHKSGFTLVELLVGIFVVSISVLALYQMFISGSQMLTEEYHRRIGLEKAQEKMELAESYGVGGDSIPNFLAGTFYEELIPPEEGRSEGIQAMYTMTITPSNERDRESGKPIYRFVTLEYSWTEFSGLEQKIMLQTYF